MATTKTRSAIPQFKSLDEESDFWGAHSVTEFDAEEVTLAEVADDSDRGQRKRRITLSLEEDLVTRLRTSGAQRRVPLSTLAEELLRAGMSAR